MLLLLPRARLVEKLSIFIWLTVLCVFSSPILFIHILDKLLLLSYVSMVSIVRIITRIDRLLGAFATQASPPPSKHT